MDNCIKIFKKATGDNIEYSINDIFDYILLDNGKEASTSILVFRDDFRMVISLFKYFVKDGSQSVERFKGNIKSGNFLWEYYNNTSGFKEYLDIEFVKYKRCKFIDKILE